MRGLDALGRSSRIVRRGLEPMRRCGVVSAIHGLRRVVLGRFVVCATTCPACPRRSGRPSLLVKISVAPGSISTGRWSRMCRFSSASNKSLIGTARTLAVVLVGPRCGDPFGGVNSCRSTSMVFCRKFTRSTVSPAASPGRRPAVAINHTNAVRCGGAASAMRRTSSKSSATTCDAAVLMVFGSRIFSAESARSCRHARRLRRWTQAEHGCLALSSVPDLWRLATQRTLAHRCG